MPLEMKSRDSFRQYVELLRQLHLLMASGRGDTAEADAVRDRMDKPWDHLDETLIDRVRVVGGSIYP